MLRHFFITCISVEYTYLQDVVPEKIVQQHSGHIVAQKQLFDCKTRFLFY